MRLYNCLNLHAGLKARHTEAEGTDMLKAKYESVVQNKFNLKNVAVELMPSSRRSEPAFIGIKELEEMRVERRAIPASKHGLETICGASCETGAQ